MGVRLCLEELPHVGRKFITTLPKAKSLLQPSKRFLKSNADSPTKKLSFIKKTALATTIGTTALYLNRALKLAGDHIPNPHNDEFTAFLAEQYKTSWTGLSKPYNATTPELLKFCPELKVTPTDIPQCTNPVVRKPLSECPYPTDNFSNGLNICVGGAPAAVTALQKAIDNEPVIYVNPDKHVASISSGSALHGQHSFVTDGSAFFGGANPIGHFKAEAEALIDPPRAEDSGKPGIRSRKNGWYEIFTNPSQIPELITMAIGFQWNANAAKDGKLEAEKARQIKEIKQSGEYLKELNRYVGGTILQEAKTTLLVTRTEDQEKSAQDMAKQLVDEDSVIKIVKISPELAKKEFGTAPKVTGLWRVEGEFVLKKDFMSSLKKSIADHGGEIQNDWILRTIYQDKDKPGGWLEFVEQTPEGKVIHSRMFKERFVSLGATTISPNAPAPMASVGGVSMQGYIIGPELKAGSIWSDSDTDHFTLVGDTRDGPVDPETQKPLRITPFQATNSARVGPRDLGKNWQDFDIQYANQLNEFIREMFPGAKHKVLTTRRCPRQLGPAGVSTWKDEEHSQGGGGALTQSAVMACRVAKNPNKPLPDVPMASHIKTVQRTQYMRFSLQSITSAQSSPVPTKRTNENTPTFPRPTR